MRWPRAKACLYCGGWIPPIAFRFCCDHHRWMFNNEKNEEKRKAREEKKRKEKSIRLRYPMGFYINPPDMTKETFLSKYGNIVEDPKNLKITPEEYPVILVSNMTFSAAAIAWCENEIKEFTRPEDPRPKLFFMVRKEHLAPYLPEDLR